MGLTEFTDKSRSRVWYAIDKNRDKVIRWDEFCRFMGQDPAAAIKEHTQYRLQRQDSRIARDLARHGSDRATSPEAGAAQSSASPSPTHGVERQRETDGEMEDAEGTTDGGRAQTVSP